jgi:hypothetical protein
VLGVRVGKPASASRREAAIAVSGVFSSCDAGDEVAPHRLDAPHLGDVAKTRLHRALVARRERRHAEAKRRSGAGPSVTSRTWADLRNRARWRPRPAWRTASSSDRLEAAGAERVRAGADSPATRGRCCPRRGRPPHRGDHGFEQDALRVALLQPLLRLPARRRSSEARRRAAQRRAVRQPPRDGGRARRDPVPSSITAEDGADPVAALPAA